LIRASAFAP